MESAAERTFRIYWLGVRDELKQKLACNGYDERWEVVFFPDIDCIFEDWAGFLITWRKRPPSCQPRYQHRGCFSFYVENIARRNIIVYGVLRGVPGIGFQNWSPLERPVHEKLKRRGFCKVGAVANWWMRYRRFADVDPLLPKFNVKNNDEVNTLDAENQNEDRPLTKRVVGLIWELFCDFRCDLEHLNRNYPYDVP